jgi:hypothetical protein
MIVLKEFAPESELTLLEENSLHNNLPRIGSDDNTAFPGGQMNLSEPVPAIKSHGKFKIIATVL